MTDITLSRWRPKSTPETVNALISTLARHRMRPPHAWWPALTAGAIMCVLGLWGVSVGSMNGTESVTYWAGHLPMSELWHVLGHVDAVHGLDYLFMHGMFFFGGGTIALRLPSVAGLVTAVILTERVGHRLTRSTTVSLTAALLLAVIPAASQYAQFGRSYGIDLALVLAAGLAFLRALDPVPRTRAAGVRGWVLYAALVALAGYMNEMTTLMLLAHGVTLLWLRSPRGRLARWAAAVGGAAIVLAPLVILSEAESAQVAWIHFNASRDLDGLVSAFFGPSAIGVVVTALLVLIALIPTRWLRRTSELRRITMPATAPTIAPERHPADRSTDNSRAHVAAPTLVQFALPLLVLPAAALLVESAIATPLYGGVRYVLYSVAGLALLAALGAFRLGSTLAHVSRMSQPRHRIVQAVCLASVAGVLLAGMPAQLSLRTPAGHPENLSAATSYVAGHAHAGDAILFIPEASSLAMLGYPQDFTKVNDIAIAVPPVQSGTLYGTRKSPATLDREILDQHRIWEFSNNGTTGMSRRQQHERVLLSEHFRMVDSRAFQGETVRLWITAPSGN